MIRITDGGQLFTLHTNNTTYQFMADSLGILQHLYYGPKTENADFSYLLQDRSRSFSGNPYDAGDNRAISLDIMPLEYPAYGCGDYREPCLEIRNPDGSNSADLRFEGYQILEGKVAYEGLPGVYASKDDSETLEVFLKDYVSHMRVVLQYTIIPECDAIVRSARIENNGDRAVVLERALSCCIDLPWPKERDMITFYGRHAGERTMDRNQLHHGKQRIDSTRGASSLHYNPSFIICDHETTEEFGCCYGMMFVYSGNFMAQAEIDQINQTRVVMGIHPQDFRWTLDAGCTFQTPEVVLSFSNDGTQRLTHNLHRLINKHLIRSRHFCGRRPILLNSWEAAYFDYDDQKLIEIARETASLGIELFVLDDGWFGKRNDDTSSLGDWFVNHEKIRCGLPKLCSEVNALGVQFGIWIEPEMISTDSDLYRSHPEWMLAIPGRPPVSGRGQYVLDMTRKDVVDYLYTTFSELLSSCNIEYVKWDMNRNISDAYSTLLQAEHQGEVFHRYILGVYDLLERLTSAFPNVLLETCSGGGGRFDAGMLYYSPQIWCSDNTDPIERMTIQYGTSYIYPYSCIGAHVSASPNHKTGRETSVELRGAVAMTGAFGYELDPTKLSEEEKQEIRKQLDDYKENWELYTFGTLYRIMDNPHQGKEYAWLLVSEKKDRAVLTYVLKSPTANAPVTYLRLRGLDENAMYRLSGYSNIFSGQALMNGGISMPKLRGNHPFVKFFINKCESDGKLAGESVI